VGGGLMLLRTGDRVRVDLRKRSADVLLPEAELHARRVEAEARLAEGDLSFVPASQTPWQEIQRRIVGQLAEGMLLEPAEKYQDIAHGPGSIPRDNH
jgi:dihydroxy-acid dehydratase